jgi:WD40 repeat protein
MMAAIRPDGRRLATASWDQTVRVWDLARAQEYRPLLAARDGSPPRVAFDPGGGRLAIARANGTLSVADVQTGETTCTAGGETAIQGLAWTGGQEIAVVRTGGRAVELRDARSCAMTQALAHPAPITAMSTRSGPRLVTAADNVVRVFRGSHVEASFAGYTGRIYKVGIDGNEVYAITNEPAAIVVDALGAPAPRRIFRDGNKSDVDVWFDREHGRVLTPSWDQFLYIWDAATGALARKLEGTGPMTAVRPSPDGSILIGVGGFSPAIWDRATGARIGQLVGHSDLVKDGEFLDDQIFVSLAGNHTALVWDVAAARPLTTFRDIDAMVFSDDRRSVAFVGAAGVRIWSPRAPAPDLDALPAPWP